MTTATVPATVFLDKTLSTTGLTQIAAAIHQKWYRFREADLRDPNNPFLGEVPRGMIQSQMTVGDFQRDHLIRMLADAGKSSVTYHGSNLVVFDPYFVESFDLLTPTQQALKLLPIQSLCYVLGDLILPAGANLPNLEMLLDDVIRGRLPSEGTTINKAAHSSLQAFRLAQNAHQNVGRALVQLGLPLYESMPDSSYRLNPESFAAAKALLETVKAAQRQ